MPRQHFSRNLRIPRFVGADKSEMIQPEKEQECAKARKQECVGPATGSSRQAGV
jgi:hypothetical protein